MQNADADTDRDAAAASPSVPVGATWAFLAFVVFVYK